MKRREVTLISTGRKHLLYKAAKGVASNAEQHVDVQELGAHKCVDWSVVRESYVCMAQMTTDNTGNYWDSG